MTIRRIGVAPEPYIDYEAALLAAVDNDTFRAATAQLFAAQVLDLSALTGITFDSTNDVGNEYTIGIDTTATYAMKLGDGFAMEGGTIRCTANVPIYSLASTWTMTGVTFQVDAGHSTAIAYPDSASFVTLDCCRILGDVQTITGGFTTLANSSIVVSGCYVHPNLTFSNGFVRVSGAATNTVTILSTNCASSPLLYVRAGQTVATATIKGCYAPHLVDNNGTITTFVGGGNAYDTTAAGTTGTGDKPGVTDFKIDWRGWPKPTSPLFRALPAGTQYGGDIDALGNPRQTGGRQDIGPIQNQSQEGLSLAVMA